MISLFVPMSLGTALCVWAVSGFISSSRRQNVLDHTKVCSQCAERIQAAALVCRYCGNRDFSTTGQPFHAPKQPRVTKPYTGGEAISADYAGTRRMSDWA